MVELEPVLLGQDRGIRIEGTAHRQWEQPLNLVVAAFQPVEWKGMDSLDTASRMIRSGAPVEFDQW